MVIFFLDKNELLRRPWNGRHTSLIPTIETGIKPHHSRELAGNNSNACMPEILPSALYSTKAEQSLQKVRESVSVANLQTAKHVLYNHPPPKLTGWLA
jgi:hypothetical protein